MDPMFWGSPVFHRDTPVYLLAPTAHNMFLLCGFQSLLGEGFFWCLASRSLKHCIFIQCTGYVDLVPVFYYFNRYESLFNALARFVGLGTWSAKLA